MKDVIHLIDPKIIDKKRIAVIGAGNLEIPLWIDSLFSPDSIDAIDAESWMEEFENIKLKASHSKGGINLFPVPKLSIDEIISACHTPWDLVISCVYLEAIENPIKYLEEIVLLTTNSLLLFTHISDISNLPVMISRMTTNRIDHHGIYWHISEGLIDTHLEFIGLRKVSDLLQSRLSNLHDPKFKKLFLKNFIKRLILKCSDLITERFSKGLYKTIEIVTLKKITFSYVRILKVLKKPKFYCKLWMKI